MGCFVLFCFWIGDWCRRVCLTGSSALFGSIVLDGIGKQVEQARKEPASKSSKQLSSLASASASFLAPGFPSSSGPDFLQ